VSTRRIATVGILVAPILFAVWYTIAANYEYGALAGTYVFRAADESCELHLRPDQTFTQEIRRSGQTQRAEGQWHRYGEAHVSFSREFIPLQKQELNGSGEAHGQFEKTLGLFPKLVLAPLPDGPTLQKKWFR
jgi:hypothetical protein